MHAAAHRDFSTFHLLADQQGILKIQRRGLGKRRHQNFGIADIEVEIGGTFQDPFVIYTLQEVTLDKVDVQSVIKGKEGSFLREDDHILKKYPFSYLVRHKNTADISW